MNHDRDLDQIDPLPKSQIGFRTKPNESGLSGPLVSGIRPWYGCAQAKRIDMEGT